MKPLFFITIIICFYSLAFSGEVNIFTDTDGIVHYEIKGSPTPQFPKNQNNPVTTPALPPAVNEIPTWETDLKFICQQADKKKELNNFTLNGLISRANALKSTIENDTLILPLYRTLSLQQLNICTKQLNHGLWEFDLENICGQTEKVKNLSAVEINQLILKSDNLKPIIDKSETDLILKFAGSRRLKACTDLLFLETDIRKQRHDYDSLVDSLKNRLK